MNVLWLFSIFLSSEVLPIMCSTESELFLILLFFGMCAVVCSSRNGTLFCRVSVGETFRLLVGVQNYLKKK